MAQQARNLFSIWEWEVTDSWDKRQPGLCSNPRVVGDHLPSGEAGRQRRRPPAAASSLQVPLLLFPRHPRPPCWRPCWLSGCTRPPDGLRWTCLGSALQRMLTFSSHGSRSPATAAAASLGLLPVMLAVGLTPSPWWHVLQSPLRGQFERERDFMWHSGSC